jgi:hypothetical protein
VAQAYQGSVHGGGRWSDGSGIALVALDAWIMYATKRRQTSGAASVVAATTPALAGVDG